MRISDRLEKWLVKAEHADFIVTWTVKILLGLGTGTLLNFLLQKVVPMSSSWRVGTWLILSGLMMWAGGQIVQRWPFLWPKFLSWDRKPVIDGEVYRVVVTPRSWVYEIAKDVVRVAGRKEPFTIDTDVLVEMYLVNKSRKDIYIRDFVASVEIDGQRRTLETKRDLLSDKMAGNDYEYALQRTKFDDNKQSLTNLTTMVHSALGPEKPLEGWIRFMVPDIVPEKLDNNHTFKFSVVDSVGREHLITKASLNKRPGEIGLRRLRG